MTGRVQHRDQTTTIMYADRTYPMPGALTISEASKLSGKAEKTIRRRIPKWMNDPATRDLISKDSTNNSYRIDPKLIEKEFGPSEIEKGTAPQFDHEQLEFLREQFKKQGERHEHQLKQKSEENLRLSRWLSGRNQRVEKLEKELKKSREKDAKLSSAMMAFGMRLPDAEKLMTEALGLPAPKSQAGKAEQTTNTTTDHRPKNEKKSKPRWWRRKKQQQSGGVVDASFSPS